MDGRVGIPPGTVRRKVRGRSLDARRSSCGSSHRNCGHRGLLGPPGPSRAGLQVVHDAVFCRGRPTNVAFSPLHCELIPRRGDGAGCQKHGKDGTAPLISTSMNRHIDPCGSHCRKKSGFRDDLALPSRWGEMAWEGQAHGSGMASSASNDEPHFGLSPSPPSLPTHSGSPVVALGPQLGGLGCCNRLGAQVSFRFSKQS
jgi:hypothetical protein